MLDNLLSKPCTILYPDTPVPIPKGFRGKVTLIDEKCIGCSRCAQVCPSGCIEMVPDSHEIEINGRKIVRKKRPQVRIYSCIRCGLCEEYCSTKAISLKNVLSCSGTDCDVIEE
jgi:NADH-quinone oxidoreductase subunit I